jgi:tRNA(Met) C34 N-acetyltransferase TmcA
MLIPFEVYFFPPNSLLALTLIPDLTPQELSLLLTPFDIKRLQSYADNLLDYHVILDTLPCIASLYFEKRMGPEVKLSAVQSSILLSLGLQRKSIEEVEASKAYFLYKAESDASFPTDRIANTSFSSYRPFRQISPKNQ